MTCQVEEVTGRHTSRVPLLLRALGRGGTEYGVPLGDGIVVPPIPLVQQSEFHRPLNGI